MKEIILTEKQFEILKESIKEKLATARQGVNTHPTEKQCKAGNYAMGHISINGFEISIENPKGSYRCGKDKNGKEWKTLMHNDYGYFTKTVGKDGDAIDVFLGPYLDDKIEDAKIYPIDQYINGEFDETKVMMGFRDKESAKAAYLSNYEKDWKGFKYISEVDIPTFKKWLYDGHRQRKPFAKYATLTESLNSIVKNGEEKKLRDTVRAMIKDKSLPTDHSLEMAEHYGNIISRAFGIDKDDINYCSDDNRIHCSIIDDEFEKQGGEYDLMDCENHKKCVKKDLEKLHSIKEGELKKAITESIRKILYEGRHAKNINMDVELRKGGRNAVKMTEKQFEEVLKAAWEEYWLGREPEEYYEIRKWNTGAFVYNCCYNSPKLNKDSKTLGALYKDIWCTKYKFDTENVECAGKIRMSNKGVPYLVCYAGGDWECPVCFIVYYDGNKIRAYIPLKGNAINRNTHQAFGNSCEEEDDIKFLVKELNLDKDEARQYVNDIDFDTNACVEDFLSRIEVKGTYKEKDFSKIHNEYEEMTKRLKKESEEKKAQEESEKEEITEAKNEEGNEIPDKCNKCGGKIELQIHSEPVYICSECGEYFGVKPRGISESMINEKFSSRKLAQLAKEHGGIEVSRNGGNRNGANAWQRGNSIDLSKVTDDMIEGEPFAPEKWVEEPNAICFNDGTMIRLKKYGQQPAPEKVKKPSKYGTGIGDTGDHDKHIGGFKTKDSISQQSAPYNGYGVSDRAGIAQGYHTALKNNHDIIDYFKNHPEREDGYKQSREAMSDISKIHNDVKNDARLSEGKKNNPPKNEVAAINKANREDDIKSHGKSITFRTTMEKNPKAYTRKEKHKKVYMTEEQFKGYCRSLLEQKRKKDYVSNILKESKWYDYDRNEDYTPEGIGGEFEVYYNENEYPITGTYSAHVEEEPQTYDYPGYSEVVLDDVQFNTQVSADFQNQIRELIDDKIKSGENGNIIIEI